MEISGLLKFGLTSSLIDQLQSLGYHTLTTVQEQAVLTGLFERKNILINAPTNTGKTFVGELAAIAASIRKEAAHTFILVPLKAIAEEKFQDINNKYSRWGLKVAISTRDRTEFDDDLLSYQVIIATYEKMNALLVRRPKLIEDVGVVVIDELQNVGEPGRGVTLEILLTRLMTSSTKPQIIGLSATISNARDMADWLDAHLVETDKRDVELREGVLFTGKESLQFNGYMLNNGDYVFREFNTGKIGIEKSLKYSRIEGIGEIAKEEQILVFTETQKKAERVAEILATKLPTISGITDVIEQLDSAVEPTPSTRRLKETLQSGVAFHHAGLLPEERSLIEDAFDKGLVRIVSATTTLGAGVNTPAKTVIILSYKTYEEKNIKTRDYKNMSGRAGRVRSRDNFGRSILFADDERELQMLWKEYVLAKPELLESQISAEKLDVSMLGLIHSGVCSTLDDLLSFIKATFFGHTYYVKTPSQLRSAFDLALTKQVRELEKDGFLKVKNGKIETTELGARCAEEILSPASVKLFYSTLTQLEPLVKKSKDYSSFVEGLIHLACCSKDAITSGALLFYPRYESELKELGDYWEYNKHSFIFTPPTKAMLIQSLKTTRMLMRWIEGVPYGDLSNYAPHGIIKRNAETISWIIKGLSRIAEKPLFNFDYEFIKFLRTLSERLFYGVPENALSIMKMKIPGIHRYRAIQLVESGFSTIDRIIEAKPEDLMKAKGIGEKLALQIKKHIEEHIEDNNLKAYHRQRRIAQSMGKNTIIIDRLYKEKGDNFARAFNDIFKDYMGLKSAFIGDSSPHEVDVIVETNEGKIVAEGKRLDRRNVSAIEAEEVIGKGSKHKPLAYVTIGYPDFSDEAKKNSPKAGVTLIPATLLGDILVGFWEGKLRREDIIEILKSRHYVEDAFHKADSDSLRS